MIRVVEILGVYYRNKGPLMWFLVSMVPQMSGPGEAVFVLLSADDLIIMKKVDLCRSVSLRMELHCRNCNYNFINRKSNPDGLMRSFKTCVKEQ